LAFVTLTCAAGAGVLLACSSSHDDNNNGDNDSGSPFTPPPPTGTATSGLPPDPGPLVDAGMTLGTYQTDVADALCNALTRCCYNNSNVPQDGGVDGGDAGSGFFNRSQCLAVYRALGFENANQGLNVTKDSITLDQTKAADCLSKIDSLTCNLDGTTLRTIRTACFDALVGQLPSGGACKVSLQCGQGLFCEAPGDGGFGACKPLRADGGACGDFAGTGDDNIDSTTAEERCSWRGGGNTDLACASYDLVTGNYKTNRADWTCEAQVVNGDICNTTVSCADGVCDPINGFLCKPALAYWSDVVCGADLTH
jgi:hypothetical protein